LLDTESNKLKPLVTIRALFNDFISSLGYIAASGGGDVNNELERIWKEAVVA
jgi:hypothetical protein